MKIAFIFPGQGAQYVGMGRGFYENYQEARDIFNTGEQILGFDIKELCFDGPQEKLNTTRYSQPAILIVSIAILRCINKEYPGLVPYGVAGLSLGEYTALVCAGCIKLEDAIKVVNKRAIYMEEASRMVKGGMLSVIGLDEMVLRDIVEKGFSGVDLANFNCPGQIVLSGPLDMLERMEPVLREKGAKRVVRLKVNGPFHSRYMNTAGEKLREEVYPLEVVSPRSVFISNVSGEPEDNPDRIKELLIRQVTSPVRWQKGMEWFIEAGVDMFVEIGPGRVLSGLLKKINRGIRCINIEKVEELSALNEIAQARGSI